MSRKVVFRANVGAVLVDRRGLVLALERADVPGAWQLPQGGLDPGEEAVDGALRELAEETGIDPRAVRLLDEYPDWLVYELPEELRNDKIGRGQAQRWFLFAWRGDAEIPLERAVDREFRAYRWMPLAELAESTMEFRRPIYRRLAERFAPHLA